MRVIFENYVCDLCGCNIEKDSSISAYYPIVFTTYEDGSHCVPRIENKTIDLCKRCAEKALNISAYILDGSITYNFIKQENK